MNRHLPPPADLGGRRIAVVNRRDLDHVLGGGAEIYAWQFARALAEAGADVHFVTSRERGQARGTVRDDITVRRGGGELTFYLFTLGWLLRRRRVLDAVIDLSGGLPAFSPLVVRRRTPVLLIVHHVHQAQFAAHFPRPVALIGRWLERVAMRRVYRRRTTAAVSASTRDEMRHQLGWRGDIQILENGADLLPGALMNAAVASKDADRIVVLGRLVAHKRVDLVLRAIARVRTRPDLADRDLHVDIVGRGPEQERLTALAAELGLGERVVFHGYLPVAAKDAILARAAMHVCGSDAEGWGQAVIDAASWGVPTVARDVPGLRDSIRPGSTGWLVPDSTDHDVVVDRLAAALEHGLVDTADPAVRAERAATCRAWAERFDWSRMRTHARELTALLLGPAAVRPDRHPRDARVAV